jgi:hypothetical protein
MAKTVKKYDKQFIGIIKKILRQHSNAGTPVDYCIRVDNIPAVIRTNDPDKFDFYKECLFEGAKEITVILYQGKSNNNTSYVLEL